MKRINGFGAALEALRGLDSKSQERILGEIARKDPEMAEKLKKNILTFDDILRINPQGRIKLLQTVAEPTLVLALRGKKEEFIKELLKPLAQRKVTLIMEAWAALGPQPLGKVEEAQKEVLEKALELKSQGLLIFAEGDDPLV